LGGLKTATTKNPVNTPANKHGTKSIVLYQGIPPSTIIGPEADGVPPSIIFGPEADGVPPSNILTTTGGGGGAGGVGIGAIYLHSQLGTYDICVKLIGPQRAAPRYKLVVNNLRFVS